MARQKIKATKILNYRETLYPLCLNLVNQHGFSVRKTQQLILSLYYFLTLSYIYMILNV